MKILFFLIALLLIAVLIDAPAFGGLMILAIAIWIVYLIAKAVGDRPVKHSKAKVKEFKLEIAPGDNSEDYSTYIAGIKVYSLLDNGAMIEIARYVKWLINNHGVEYAPRELNASGEDIDAWHAVLDNIIAENESALLGK